MSKKKKAKAARRKSPPVTSRQADSKRSTAKRPTIRDVARLAGVARMTVSRVLSEPDLVLPDKREQVLRAVAHLGYVPDRTAGSLATRRTGFIALLIPTLTNANFSSVAHGLTEVLRPTGYQLLIGYTDYSPAEEERQIRSLLTRRPEAIVLAGAGHSHPISAYLANANVPVIEVAEFPARPTGHVVGFSNYAVGRMAARYLADAGFQRFGAVGSVSSEDTSDTRGEERLRGFSDELTAAGIPSDLILRQGSAPVSYSHGAAAFATLIAREPGLEALFAVSDLSAIGVMMECRRRNLEIPRQISLIGFGDFEVAAAVHPALTTIGVDFRGMGRRAGELLVSLLSSPPNVRPAHIDVGLSLIERGTVAGRGTAVV